MKIAILYICTGQYDVFWHGFYKSAKALFCVSEQKHFFVFTDSKAIQSSDDVSVIYQDSLGWPFNTLYRYRMFNRVRDQISTYDYVAFINSNSVFVDNVTFSDFFGQDKKLVACIHPGFYDKQVHKYTYERRVTSSAKVFHPHHYFAGGINGGSSDGFWEAVDFLIAAIEHDLDHGVMALWHDESHWNAFLNNQYEEVEMDIHILSPSYMYPEDWNIPFKPKILLRDKSKLLNVNSIKPIRKIKFFKRLLNKLRGACGYK